MRAFHSNWTRPFFARHGKSSVYSIPAFELLTTALSSLMWQRENGTIAMLCDSTALSYYQNYEMTFLWNDGVSPVLDAVDADIDPICFWAAGKLYALRTFGAPCMMIDTDFIVWHSLSEQIKHSPIMTIHEESICPDIYPDRRAFRTYHGSGLDALDWTVLPVNTALAWFGDPDFTALYTQTAIDFMRAASPADHVLTYMVFAEQRLLSMLARQQQLPLTCFSDLQTLFSPDQQCFTHIWGQKQRLLSDPIHLQAFCARCAYRLCRDFPREAQQLAQIPDLFPYFQFCQNR